MQKGQALITLLFFTIIAVSILSAAAVMILVNSLNGTKLQEGSRAYEIATTGAENGLLRLMRDPTYTGETLPVGSGSAVIQVTSTNGTAYTILSQGQIGDFVRKVQINATYTNNLFTVTSQKEIF